jgi:single-strand DNA-binding protein
MNHCIVSGNLGADPESVFTSEGTHIATFSLAFRSSKDKTGWIKVACFNKLAETAEKYLHKGAKVAVSGMLDQDKWEKDGAVKTAHKIIAQSLDFIKTDGRGFENGQEDVPF